MRWVLLSSLFLQRSHWEPQTPGQSYLVPLEDTHQQVVIHLCVSCSPADAPWLFEGRVFDISLLIVLSIDSVMGYASWKSQHKLTRVNSS